MKNLQLSATAILLILAVIYILYLTQCNSPRPCPPVAKFIIDTQAILATSQPKIDTIYQPGDTIYRSRLVSVRGKDSMIFVPVQVVKQIPAVVDTQAILKDYYSLVIQRDSLQTEDVKVYVTDTVNQNRITGRAWNVTILKKIQKPKRQFYIGGEGYTSTFMNKGLSTELVSAASFGVGYINRQGEHFKIGLMRTGGRWHQGIGFYHTFD
jgi:hypothetical protein